MSEDKEKERLEAVLKSVERVGEETDDTLEKLGDDRDGLVEEIKSLHDQLESAHKLRIEKYNKRLTWIMFTAMFVIICLGALVAAGLIIY